MTVTVSGGKGTVAVPAVEGQSQEDAQQALRDAGFKTSVKEAFSDTVPEGEVISTSPRGGTQATKGRTVTLTVSQGSQGVAVPKLVGLQRADAEAQLEAAGLVADVTEQESTQPAGTVMEQDPPTGTSVEKGATVKLTVAKERPEVPDVTTDHPTEEEATAILEQAGFKVQVRTRPDPENIGRVSDQSPVEGTRRSSGATVTIYRRLRRRRSADADPDPDPDAMRVAVLAGGRSSEHDVSLNSAAAVREGIAAAGHEVLPVTIERSGAWLARGRGAEPASQRRPARRGRRIPGAARPVRRGRHLPGPARAARRALRRRGVLASALCMDKSSSRRSWRPRTSRRSPTPACASPAGRPSPRSRARARGARDAGVRQARAARGPPSGSRRCGRRPSWARRSTSRSPTTAS